MKRSTSIARWIRWGAALVVATACLRPIAVRAQVDAGAEAPAFSPQPAARLVLASDRSTAIAVGTTQEPVRSLTLRDAIQRGLTYNLRLTGLMHAADQARGREAIAKSALMPNLSGDFSASEQQTNLAAMGLRLNVPGLLFDDVVRFSVIDLRARLSQTIYNQASMNTYRAAGETVRANELSLDDSRDLIVLSVGGAYLETLAARARLRATQAQIDTATSLHQKTVQRQSAGLATPLDVNRAQARILTARQRLALQQADFTKRKINLARMIGMPPNDQYDLADDVPFSPAPAIPIEDTLKQAAERRYDLQAAEANVRAAERGLEAAKAERLPSVAVTANYGGNRATDRSMRQTFLVAGLVRVPIWEGGRTAGVIEQASAVLMQRQTELDDIKAQIEAEVRLAYADITAAAAQIAAADANVGVSRDNLVLTRQRFDAGIADNLAVVQSQEALAGAEYDYINSVFAHNLAKLSLARTVGRASEDIGRYLVLP
jgi:outer membrane protein TolC